MSALLSQSGTGTARQLCSAAAMQPAVTSFPASAARTNF